MIYSLRKIGSLPGGYQDWQLLKILCRELSIKAEDLCVLPKRMGTWLEIITLSYFI